MTNTQIYLTKRTTLKFYMPRADLWRKLRENRERKKNSSSDNSSIKTQHAPAGEEEDAVRN